MTTPRRERPGRGSTKENRATPIVPPAYVGEVASRLEAAASMLAYGLLGECALELAAESALRMVMAAQRHLRAAA
jgi:hypothetical protein